MAVLLKFTRMAGPEVRSLHPHTGCGQSVRGCLDPACYPAAASVVRAPGKLQRGLASGHTTEAAGFLILNTVRVERPGCSHRTWDMGGHHWVQSCLWSPVPWSHFFPSPGLSPFPPKGPPNQCLAPSTLSQHLLLVNPTHDSWVSWLQIHCLLP